MHEKYWHTSLQDASRCLCKTSEDTELTIQMIWGEREGRQHDLEVKSSQTAFQHHKEGKRKRTTQFKIISFKADKLKNREKKPTDLRPVKSSSVSRLITHVVFCLVRKQRLGNWAWFTGKLEAHLETFLSLTPNMTVYIFIIQLVNSGLLGGYRDLLRICRSLFKGLLFLHYQVVQAGNFGIPHCFWFCFVYVKRCFIRLNINVVILSFH